MAKAIVTGWKELDAAFANLEVKVQGKALRSALRAGAQRIQAAAIANLIKNPSIDTGKLATGFGVRAAKRRKGRVGMDIITKGVAHANLVEYGTKRMPAEPFLRPAGYDNKEFIGAALVRDIQEAAKDPVWKFKKTASAGVTQSRREAKKFAGQKSRAKKKAAKARKRGAEKRKKAVERRKLRTVKKRAAAIKKRETAIRKKALAKVKKQQAAERKKLSLAKEKQSLARKHETAQKTIAKAKQKYAAVRKKAATARKKAAEKRKTDLAKQKTKAAAARKKATAARKTAAARAKAKAAAARKKTSLAKKRAKAKKPKRP